MWKRHCEKQIFDISELFIESFNVIKTAAVST